MIQAARPAAPDDTALVAALRVGEEGAFVGLVERYHGALVRTAMTYVRDRDVAEEVVQEGWIAVIRGLDRFEGRSSLATWIFRIVTYQARTRGTRERRTVPLSTLEPGPDEPAVDDARFNPIGSPWPGHWAEAPQHWGPDASERLLAGEARAVIDSVIETLPPAQRTVLTLRDIQGFDSDEVCAALGISAGNQRVLLHRARSRVRAALERYMAAAEAA